MFESWSGNRRDGCFCWIGRKLRNDMLAWAHQSGTNFSVALSWTYIHKSTHLLTLEWSCPMHSHSREDSNCTLTSHFCWLEVDSYFEKGHKQTSVRMLQLSLLFHVRSFFVLTERSTSCGLEAKRQISRPVSSYTTVESLRLARCCYCDKASSRIWTDAIESIKPSRRIVILWTRVT